MTYVDDSDAELLDLGPLSRQFRQAYVIPESEAPAGGSQLVMELARWVRQVRPHKVRGLPD
jgi:hypothetical protein